MPNMVSYVSNTRTFSIIGNEYIVGGSFNILLNSINTKIYTPLSCVHDNTSGLHYIYLDFSGALRSYLEPVNEFILVARIYFNASSQEGIVYYKFYNDTDIVLEQTRYYSGFDARFTNGSINTRPGVIITDDTRVSIAAQNRCRILYKNNSSVWSWTTGSLSYFFTSNSNLVYNSGLDLAAIQSNYFVTYFVFITSDKDYPIHIVIGQREDVNLDLCKQNNNLNTLDLANISIKDYKLLYKLYVQNGTNPQLYEVEDVRLLRDSFYQSLVTLNPSMASPGIIGGTTPNVGNFTTLNVIGVDDDVDVAPGDHTNRITIDGPVDGDKSVIFMQSGVKKWGITNYRGESSRYFYVVPYGTDEPVLVMSEVGATGINKKTDFMEKHPLYYSDIALASGLDSVRISGVYSGHKKAIYEITITATGTPDKYKWRKTYDGVTWTALSSEINCHINDISLDMGIIIRWNVTTGHTTADKWGFVGFTQNPLGVFDIASPMFSEVYTVEDTGTPVYVSRTYAFALGLCPVLGDSSFYVLQTTDAAIYLGMDIPIGRFSVTFARAGEGLGIKLWYGTDINTWTEITTGTHNLVDTSDNFSNAGTLSWDYKACIGWVKVAALPGKSYEKYWIKITTIAVTTVPRVNTIAPLSEYILATYGSNLNGTPSAWIDHQGHIHAVYGYRESADISFEPNEWVTEKHVQQLISGLYSNLQYLDATGTTPFDLLSTLNSDANVVTSWSVSASSWRQGPVFVSDTVLGISQINANSVFNAFAYVKKSTDNRAVNIRFRLGTYTGSTFTPIVTGSDIPMDAILAIVGYSQQLVIAADTIVNPAHYLAIDIQFYNVTTHAQTVTVYTGTSYPSTLGYPMASLGGVGTLAVQNSGDVTITGGSITGLTDISIAGTTGGFKRQFNEATSGTLSGATGSIAVNIPSGARILGVQLRVDTAITSGTGGTWSAVYVNTPTTAICSGQAFTKNTKFNAIHPAYEITTGTVTITLAPNTGTFSAGVVRAIVYYEAINAMINAV